MDPTTPTPPAFQPTAKQTDLVRAAQVRMLVDGTNGAVIVSLINVALVAFVQRTAVAGSTLIAWSTVMVIVLSARLFVNFLYFREDPSPTESHRWSRILTAMTAVSGSAWGAIGFVMTPAQSLPHQVFTAFVCAGMGAGAMASLYPLRSAYVAYVVPLLAPLILRMFSEPDEIHLIMGTMVSLFLAYILIAAGQLREILAETLLLRFRNETLSRDLHTESMARAGSEQRLRNVVENAADAIFVHDIQGRFLDVNQHACDTLGYNREELLNLSVKDIEKGLAPLALEAIWNQEGAGAFPITLEGKHIRRDGTTFPVEVRLGLLDNRDDVRFIAVARDVTERKKMDRMKSEFISTVSHELRTPLTSIIGSLGLIATGTGGALPEKAQSMVTLAQRNAQRLIDLVNDILDFDTLESGEMTFSFGDVKLDDLIREAVDAHEGFAAQHDVHLVLNEPLPPAVVVGDARRLAQVLSNLLSNATKFSDPGGTVKIGLSVRDDRVRVSVADTGEGIAAEFRDHIFTRFSQAGDATTRRQGGTGLGLAISKAIVHAHHGVMDFDSAEGAGSTFYFDLPTIGDGSSRPCPAGS